MTPPPALGATPNYFALSLSSAKADAPTSAAHESRADVEKTLKGVETPAQRGIRVLYCKEPEAAASAPWTPKAGRSSAVVDGSSLTRVLPTSALGM